MRIIEYGESARTQLKLGVSQLCNAVSSTMGPGGNPVILDNVMGAPIITADGVTVAEEIELQEPVAQMGVAIVKTAARQTNQEAGDGTTTATVLANAMLQRSGQPTEERKWWQFWLKKNESSKKDVPYHFKKGMERACEDVFNYLDSITLKIEKGDKETLAQIATISARGDRAMGELIAEAFLYTGMEGQVLMEEGKKPESSIEKVYGYQVDKGFLMREFVTEEAKGICNLLNPYVLVFDDPVADINQIFPFMQKAVDNNRPLVIVTPDMEKRPLATIMANLGQNKLKTCVIEAPEFGEKSTMLLTDLCFMTGAKLITRKDMEDIMRLKDTKNEEDYLGSCESLIAAKNSSVFINGNSDKGGISEEEQNERIENLIDETDDKVYFNMRKSRLSGRLAKIIIGASSSVEMKEKRDRVEDALNATKAAIEEGYVPGAGMALYGASKHLEDTLSAAIPEAELKGYEVVMESIKVPAQTILNNLIQDEELTDLMLSKSNGFFGYDVKTLEFVHLVKAGIIDPVKVTKSALKAAQSIAGTIISTNCVVALTGENGDLRLQ